MRLLLITACLPLAMLAQEGVEFTVQTGTRIPLSLINSVSTKSAVPGDNLYLETVFPILAGGRIVIPPGSYVMGTVTQVKRPGKIKGRAELYLQFKELILPNGVRRDFRGQIEALDGSVTERLKRKEGKIEGDGAAGHDAAVVGGAAVTGASIGTLAGIGSRAPYRGLGVGSAAGAAAGLVGVLVTRGPEAVLSRGTTMEMVLDRDLVFAPAELNNANQPVVRNLTKPAVPEPRPARTPLPSPGRPF